MEKKQNPEWGGDFSREDSNTEKHTNKSDNENSASSPFARDKRPRIRRVKDELNERVPRPRFEQTEDSERTSRPRFERDDSGERAPRPRFDRTENKEGGYRSRFDREGDSERASRPRFERDGEHRSPYKKSGENDEPRFQNRRYSDNRPERESGQQSPRRSYNPNFDENNRLKSPYRKDRNNELTEEDKRFNSYNYEGKQPGGDHRSSGGSSYSRGDKPYTSRTGGYGSRGTQDDKPRYNREDRPRSDRYGRDNQSDSRYGKDDRPRTDRYGNRGDQENKPRYNRDGQGPDKPRYNREDRPQGDRYGREGRSDRYGREDQRGGRDNRFNKDQRDTPSFDKRRDNRSAKPNDPFKTPKGGYDSEYKPKVYPAYSAANIQEPIRLNKFISMSGLCSRREADDFIKEGNITVNGKVITEMGVKIEPTDTVCFNGEVLQGEKRVYILMNKPKGFVTTVEDPNADRTVMDIVRNACKERVYPVGRLDKNSLGVLLITNDGELTKKLTHPSHQKKKIYQVALDRAATAEELAKLYEGVELEDGVAKADEVEFLDDSRREVGITIHTGRNRIVRRMFEELGYHVQKLDRVYFAGLTKKGLRRGAWRYLTPKEVAMLKAGSYE